MAGVNLDVGSHAVILALESDPASETTMDGCPNPDTSAWFCDHDPIQIGWDAVTIQQQGLEWITEGSARR